MNYEFEHYRFRIRGIRIVLFVSLVIIIMLAGQSDAQNFKNDQLRYPRVRAAAADKEAQIKKLFKDKSISYPPQNIFIRIFKREMVLELWARSDKNDSFSLVKNYHICNRSGTLGPKRNSECGVRNTTPHRSKTWARKNTKDVFSRSQRGR